MNRGVVAASLFAVTCLQVAPALAEEPAPPAPDAAAPTEPAPQATSPGPAPAPTQTMPVASPPPTKMVETNEQLVINWRWPRWIPWTVFGGGLALTGFGLLVEKVAIDDANAYDQAVASTCSVNGCNLSNPQTPEERALNDLRERAESRDKIAAVVMIAGAATLVTGIVLVVLNKPIARKVTVDVVPAPGGASTSVGWRF